MIVKVSPKILDRPLAIRDDESSLKKKPSKPDARCGMELGINDHNTI